ncbi:patatin-like phospholipase family protein [Rossellomorea aquimaris]|uniref:Patatin family protein n=1 Tax=Rossellomorea aquimaris TaxID=189382 RepID=A0A5D4U6J6_9BACI|nr:patatin family protein [Rossellomorea aquimaris]TYS82699.1 patatin family protein [Rossellomorea aquimaris]
MLFDQTGLVLEGGGMRGVYTAGVLEYLLENEVEFPYVIGVSAGACIAASYLSKQKGRNKKVNIGFAGDPNYLSWRNYFKNRELFGMDFVFNEIPNKIVPYDYEAFQNSTSQFVIGTTDCHTGESVYHNRSDYGEDVLTPIRASSSLPFVAPVVQFQSRHLLDGGISDPIPVRKAEADGYSKNVVILTRNKGYLKSPSKFNYLVKRKYPQYPGLREAMMNRYKVYNETVEYLEKEEERGSVFIIRPEMPLKVGRIERNPRKLEELYNQGYEDARLKFEELLAWKDVQSQMVTMR